MTGECIIPTNPIKRALRDGRFVLGTMVSELRQPSVMQVLANAGFDFVFIDNEHGPYSLETIADLCRGARCYGLTPIVRIPEISYAHVARPLDAGAQGLMVPRIFNAAQVRDVLEMMKFPPVGLRGNSLERGYTNFKGGSVKETIAAANEETLLVVQIETKAAAENLEEIVSIPGVDVALVGPNDLSIALGVPGQINSPEVRSVIEAMIDTCQRHGVVPAIQIDNLDLALEWIKRGMRMVGSTWEIGLMARGAMQVVSFFNDALGRKS